MQSHPQAEKNKVVYRLNLERHQKICASLTGGFCSVVFRTILNHPRKTYIKNSAYPYRKTH